MTNLLTGKVVSAAPPSSASMTHGERLLEGVNRIGHEAREKERVNADPNVDGDIQHHRRNDGNRILLQPPSSRLNF